MIILSIKWRKKTTRFLTVIRVESVWVEVLLRATLPGVPCGKTPLPSAFFLCLSRAWFGKSSVFTGANGSKRLRNGFRTEEGVGAACQQEVREVLLELWKLVSVLAREREHHGARLCVTIWLAERAKLGRAVPFVDENVCASGAEAAVRVLVGAVLLPCPEQLPRKLAPFQQLSVHGVHVRPVIFGDLCPLFLAQAKVRQGPGALRCSSRVELVLQ